VPRPAKPVKTKDRNRSRHLGTSIGAVDLHFHGAFGIDLMSARPAELDALSIELWKRGIAAICPTTLSSPKGDLKDAVRRLGEWIRRADAPGAKPLGIHLEGPFISPQACGAHPPGVIRGLTFPELEDLWEISQKTLKILTVAPETLPESDLRRLGDWAKKNRVRLSLGHSRCTESQARAAFDRGFTGITHAWNALAYHHRDLGALGAALGRPGVAVELIIDQVHVSPTLMSWTIALHDDLVFVSDAAPPAGLSDDRLVNFGELRCRIQGGAARLENGALAGGGLLLPDAFAAWLKTHAGMSGEKIERLFKHQLPFVAANPLRAIGVKESALKKRRVQWRLDRNGTLACVPEI